MTGLLRRLRARLRYRHFDQDMKAELDAHRAMAEGALRASGASAEDARREAARQLGNVTLARESGRAVWVAPWLESVWQDVRYGARSLAHSPGFTAAALVTLTLGIGVNTTLFALANALLLQPWPVPAAHEVIVAHHRLARTSGEMLVGVSAPEMVFLREGATTVDVAASRQIGGALEAEGVSRSINGRLISGNYFDVLRAAVVIGRGLHPDDDQPGRPVVVVLGHALWTAAFGARPDVVGHTIRFRGVPATIVGVAGPNVRESALTGIPELWVPLAAMAPLHPDEAFAQEFNTSAAHCCVDLVGRLRSGASRGQAEAELSALDRQFRSEDPQDTLGMRVAGTETAYDPEAERMLPVFGLLFAGVLLVLVLTCANVGNLQLARAAARRREITVRLALGANRRRVVRQLLTEGFVLSGAATVFCVTVSSMVARMLVARMDASAARVLDFSLDVRVLAFAAVLTVAAALVTSLAPALRGTRLLLVGRTPQTAGVRIRSTFLAAQVAASVVLLTAAVLLGRGLSQAAGQDVGYSLDTLVAMHIRRPSQGAAYDPVLRRADDDRVFLRNIAAAIGSRKVAIAVAVPLGDFSLHTSARRAGTPDEADLQVRFHPVSPNYFEVLGIPLRSGRTFNDSGTGEVVLNETLARMLWPDGAAIGGHLAGPSGSIGREVVGVVADAHLNGLGAVGPIMFTPVESASYLLFNDGEETADGVRAIVAGVDAAATTTLRAVGDNVGDSLEAATQGVRVAGSLGLLALAIVAVGVAGVFSFAVTERTREIGIRLALGARRRDVRLLLLRRSSAPILVGVLFGLALAMVAGLALRSYLYGLGSMDPLSYAGVIGVVAITAWLATALPLRRALRVDPAITLRHE